MKTNQKQYENRQMAISTLTGIEGKNVFVRVCVGADAFVGTH